MELQLEKMDLELSKMIRDDKDIPARDVIINSVKMGTNLLWHIQTPKLLPNH